MKITSFSLAWLQILEECERIKNEHEKELKREQLLPPSFYITAIEMQIEAYLRKNAKMRSRAKKIARHAVRILRTLVYQQRIINSNHLKILAEDKELLQAFIENIVATMVNRGVLSKPRKKREVLIYYTYLEPSQSQ